MKDLCARRHRVERKARIETILRAGRTLFLSKGHASTTMRDICRAARLSTGAVYFYFSGKDEIYASICEESFHVLLDMFAAAIEEGAPALDRLAALKTAYLQFYRTHNERWVMLSSGFRTADLPPELYRRLEQLDLQAIGVAQNTVRDLLAERGLDGVWTSQEVTLALWASVEGLFKLHSQKYFEYLDITLEEMVDTQIAVILQGLQQRAPGPEGART